jgi:DNA polymerase-1
MDSCVNAAKDTGYAITMKGRKRYLADINSGNATVRGFAERNAINSPIQGTAADMIKIAMIRIHHKISTSNLKSKMILQVHDELLFDVLKSELDAVTELVRHEMMHAMEFSIPLEVGIGHGNNWLEAH